MNHSSDRASFVEIAADIVSAFITNNHVQRGELASLIESVHGALTTASTQASNQPALPEHPKATTQEIKRSLAPDHLVSFEDGKRYKTLGRHLTLRGLTPRAYREKWDLPADYPMVSSNYSQRRSEMAKALGFGQQRRRGLAKVSAANALKVEALRKVAESPASGAARDAAVLAEVIIAPKVVTPAGKAKRAGAANRAGSTRTRKAKREPAAA